MTDDPRLAAARYLQDRLADGEQGEVVHEADAAPESTPEAPVRPTAEATERERAAYVETAIQQAIRRGEFDDLPGAGKPIPGLGATHDPDWWIRRKIETEKLTGLGPPALTLRVEAVQLADRLDELRREEDVRDVLEDFNRRVVEARRQLLGGPPVVTPTRDIDAEVAAWRERRDARTRAAEAQTDAASARRRWRWRGWIRRRR
ncbi:MAG: DUF1992 domain-containing protein [Microbacterium sp.]